MPQTPRPQPLTSSCALCAEEGFESALDLQFHTTSAHFRLSHSEPQDEDLEVAE